MNFFSRNLRYLREKHTLTQDDMQPLVGIKKTTWSHYETGKSQPSIEVLIKISRFFGVTLNDLIVEDLAEKDGPDAVRQRRHKPYVTEVVSTNVQEPTALGYIVKELKRLKHDVDVMKSAQEK